MAVEVFSSFTGAFQAVSVLSDFTELLPKMISNVEVVVTQVVDLIDKAMNDLDKIKRDKVDLSYQAKDAFLHVFEAYFRACEYADSVKAFFYYGQQRSVVAKVKRDIQSGNYGGLVTLLDQLKISLAKSGSKYKEFCESSCEASRKCILAAGGTKKAIITAGTKKRLTKGIGGAAAATSLAVGAVTGVTLSIVAGVCTAGVGTVVGLGITAGTTALGGAAIGAGTAVATHVVASHFQKIENQLRRLSQGLDYMEHVLLDQTITIGEFNCKFEHLASIIDDVDRNMLSSSENEILVCTIDYLFKTIQEFHTYSTACSESVSLKKPKLEFVVNSMFQ